MTVPAAIAGIIKFAVNGISVRVSPVAVAARVSPRPNVDWAY
jgi:hypothetical protein